MTRLTCPAQCPPPPPADCAGDLVDRQWLHRCDLAPACAPHWPTGLVPTWERVVQSMQNGSNTCVGDHWPWLSGRAGADRLRLQLKALAASWWSRPLGPAVIWRLDRCSAEDVAQLEAWMATNGLNETQPPPPPTNLTIPGMFGPFTHVGGLCCDCEKKVAAERWAAGMWGARLAPAARSPTPSAPCPSKQNFLIQDLVAFNDWMPPSALQGLNASDPGDRALLAAAADRWQAASLQGANFSLAALADKFPLLWCARLRARVPACLPAACKQRWLALCVLDRRSCCSLPAGGRLRPTPWARWPTSRGCRCSSCLGRATPTPPPSAFGLGRAGASA